MCPFDVEARGDDTVRADAVADIAVASNDDAAKLRRALVAGGVGQAATALYMALFKQPAGLFLRGRFLHYSYYIALVGVVLFGVAEAWVGLWVSRDPRRRRAVGVAVLWASLLPLLLLVGVGASRL
ncbi:hypothetical protein QOZ80_4AG0305770 [Eleusine coracana subsp. coracana]|nr:hypothetical protein QOZ80_4AG0305770 [Eleusine coracana subsp. coracana]